ncbi:MAG: pyridoxamine 5'-phosphate oxidase [Stenotrophomonas sp.]|nr:pyridoxamine 5'-phosphate oxidase [Stenotrophomonas sp.]
MTDLYAEALSTFAELFEEAKASNEIEPLLKSFDERGFVFYTHLDSRKGRELHANRQAALLLLWRSLRGAGIQVRIDGDAQLVSAAEADAYFASRPRMSQIGAWASVQSQTLGSREEFEERLRNFEARFEGRDVPRPDGWSGIRVVPQRIEFWYGATFRLHERWCYEADAAGTWSKRLLYP